MYSVYMNWKVNSESDSERINTIAELEADIEAINGCSPCLIFII